MRGCAVVDTCLSDRPDESVGRNYPHNCLGYGLRYACNGAAAVQYAVCRSCGTACPPLTGSAEPCPDRRCPVSATGMHLDICITQAICSEKRPMTGLSTLYPPYILLTFAYTFYDLFSGNWLGEKPNFLRKRVEKYFGSLKPTEYASSEIRTVWSFSIIV